MRGILYGRLSQDRSGLSENTGIQTAEGTDYCHDQGWPIAAQFVDDDTSASRYTKKTRPGYQDMLAFIKADTHHDDPLVIVITEMPRLYRKLEELLDLIRLAETTPLGKIETTNGMGYDLTTGQGIHAAVTAVSTGVLESR